MTKLDDFIDALRNTKNKFIAVCTNANRDLPFHDAYNNDFYDTVTSYVVGSNQIEGTGDQKKHFVAKSTLIYSTVERTLKFNSENNVPVLLLANVFYEFKSNIHSVFFDISHIDDLIYLWFEGVMYNEARRPE
jgi:hypothetical protein